MRGIYGKEFASELRASQRFYLLQFPNDKTQTGHYGQPSHDLNPDGCYISVRGEAPLER